MNEFEQAIMIRAMVDDRCPLPGCDGQDFQLLGQRPEGGMLPGHINVFECQNCFCHFEVTYAPIGVKIIRGAQR